MPLIYIGRISGKKVFLTAYSQRRLAQRNLSAREALQILAKREICYPIDVDGRQKVRCTLGKKKTFLTIMEDAKK